MAPTLAQVSTQSLDLKPLVLALKLLWPWVVFLISLLKLDLNAFKVFKEDLYIFLSMYIRSVRSDPDPIGDFSTKQIHQKQISKQTFALLIRTI